MGVLFQYRMEQTALCPDAAKQNLRDGLACGEITCLPVGEGNCPGALMCRSFLKRFDACRETRSSLRKLCCRCIVAVCEGTEQLFPPKTQGFCFRVCARRFRRDGIFRKLREPFRDRSADQRFRFLHPPDCACTFADPALFPAAHKIHLRTPAHGCHRAAAPRTEQNPGKPCICAFSACALPI